MSKKKAAEAKMAERAAKGVDDIDDTKEDIFELQHHHLLRCLEKTTVGIIEKSTPFFYINYTKKKMSMKRTLMFSYEKALQRKLV